jgi:hypothetical protein
MNRWWKELVRLWWPEDDQVRPSPEVRKWLASKRRVARRIAPRSIGEIGVRAGYSAFAMMSAAPDATFLGVDVGDSDHYGTEPGALEHGEKVLARFPHAMIVVCDSHDLKRLPPLDLLHIDGDHSYEGCQADLALALRSGVRYALVDDYDTGDVVCRAVDDFAASEGLEVEHIADGFRGSALLALGAGVMA